MSIKSFSVIGVVIALSLAGCSTAYKSYTSGQIGCAEDAIEITNLDQGLYNSTWVATCKGKRFFCSQTGGSGTTVKQVTCKEELK